MVGGAVAALVEYFKRCYCPVLLIYYPIISPPLLFEEPFSVTIYSFYLKIGRVTARNMENKIKRKLNFVMVGFLVVEAFFQNEVCFFHPKT